MMAVAVLVAVLATNGLVWLSQPTDDPLYFWTIQGFANVGWVYLGLQAWITKPTPCEPLPSE